MGLLPYKTMLSIIIPAFREPLLQKTIDSLLENAEGEIEIIPVLDGWEIPIKSDKRVRAIKLLRNQGMRGAINTGIEISRGEWVMKLDAHCLFGPGYDRIMIENCIEDWVMIPERWTLDEDNWRRDENRPVRRSHYLTFPVNGQYGYHMSPANSRGWDAKMGGGELLDTMSFQGSCWMVNRKYFNRYVGAMDGRATTYGPFACENLEVGLGYWLSGGEVKINTKTWYAHLSKRQHHYDSGEYSRSFKKFPNVTAGYTWAAKRWIEDDRFPAFLEKFWPIPTWEDDWREKWGAYGL